MDLLKDWLATTIERELTEVLQRRESDVNQGQAAGRVGNLSYEDDGSNLRVKSAQSGVVQVIKFLTFDDPTQAVLSDSHTRINASFAAAAVGRYEKDKRQSFSKGKVGGLIQILDFEIVATHLGPRSSNLTLYVKDFKSLGCDGSGGYGIPTAIESKDGLGFKLVQKLKLLRAQEAASSHLPSKQRSLSRTPSVCSQAGSISSGDEGPHTSQPTFATQVPRAGMTARKNGPNYSSRDMTAPAVQHYSISDSLKPLLTTAGSRPASRMHNVPSSGRFQRSTDSRARPPPNKEDPLLELLEQAQIEQAKRATFQTVSMTVSSTASTRSVAKNIKEPIDLGSSILRPVWHSSSSIVAPAANGAKVPEIVDNPPTECIGEKESIVERISPSVIPKKRKIRDRIRSKDVTIPKDQERLLSSLDAWLPAEPGRRQPTANVPITNLQAFNRDADLHRAQRTRSQNNTLNADPSSQQRRNDVLEPSLELDHHEKQESESDVPLSSAQWPASPARNQLPPDSSVSGTEQSDHKSRQRSVRATSVQSKRSSYASVSSRSIISNSPGEGMQRSKCQAEGWCKPYKNAGGLKYHVKRYHNDSGSFENVMCSQGNCDKSYTSPGDLKYDIECHQRPEKSRARGGASRSSDRSRNSTPTSAILETNDQSGEKAGDAAVNGLNGSVFGDSSKCPGAICHAPRKLETNEWAHGVADSLTGDIHSPLKNPERMQRNARGPSLSHSSESTPDSDLEMTIPLPLQETTNSQNKSVAPERYPSTASQPEQPFTQVKETPYTNAHTRNTKLQQAEHPNLSTTVDISLPIDSHIENIIANKKRSLENQQNLSKAPKYGNEKNREESLNYNAIAQRRTSPHNFIMRDQNNADNPGPGSDTMKFRTSLHENVNKEFGRAVEGDSRTKRKVLDSSFLFPLSSKRRKATKFPAALSFSQDPDDLPDPSVSLRQHRQDWFASRRSSESSAARESPTSAPPKRVGTLCCPEQDSQQTRGALSRPNDMEDDGGPDCFDSSTMNSAMAKREYNRHRDLHEVNESFPVSSRQSSKDTKTGTPISEERGNGYFIKPTELDTPSVDADNAIKFSLSTQIAEYPLVHSDGEVSLPSVKDEDHPISLMESEGALLDGSHVPLATPLAQSDHTIHHTAKFSSPSTQNKPLADPRATILEDDAAAAKLPMESSGQDANDPEDLDLIPLHTTTEAHTGGKESETFHESSRDLAHAAIEKSASPELFLSTSKSRHEHGSVTVEPESKPRDVAHARDLAPHPGAQLQRRPTAPVNIFFRFKATYPDYTGDWKHFVALGKRIQRLLKDDRMEHRSLWDDFVIRHKINYAQYVFECTEEATDPFPYEKYYSIMIDGPKYTKRVITPQNLHEILCLEGSLRPACAKQPGEGFASRYDVSEHKINPQAEPLGAGTDKFSTARLTIDLTEEDEDPKDLSHQMAGFSPTDVIVTGKRATPCIKAGIAHSGKEQANKSKAMEGSSMLTFDQPRPSSTSAPIETQERSGPGSWWQDHNTPFRTFVRAYTLIRPGNGNSYAKKENIEHGARLHHNKRLDARELDFWGWHL